MIDNHNDGDRSREVLESLHERENGEEGARGTLFALFCSGFPEVQGGGMLTSIDLWGQQWEM
ncbi:hypothetical protein U27_04486 [Candidatus Vecturithrix granuli]|uniref:Uncharacterized protein n=1 Tax=Vecturithrix granuli TaxID=1499967 RepID=A0A081BYW4_VECG1|nr:hypothetical protein U27_04486 [Candidatus Vecturithrix granuli]